MAKLSRFPKEGGMRKPEKKPKGAELPWPAGYDHSRAGRTEDKENSYAKIRSKYDTLPDG
uniref:Uncharacterized protein n=1 Tax=Pristionchus pacificus TaxID=54126 RepID=A0A2A6BCK5_PRIPA|eukprot:PDM63622.1 hypothetical protein PRIPAC_49595 [Pristionchus pacificus]